ncbi:sulfatase-like hydrolase/transferase [Paenibacillus allorhizosphaerae]|uniref:Bifunctional sulfatase/alpha-L-rhamnosidase n=1 Tax=Paenibacillus allorhizosphaerae TaxID=2849866 RepID=A0ABM8VV36_9BACL|nr:sulfatase-like hydrolase/transferase [Paenibacillus allorhizosphaerae]CAG7659045.1 Bifunctional sulfatase/alpha-L-rhamnosidase [Paenibacillus allorhizosphaerae]
MALKKPNVLILLTDDQRFDTIHGLGNKTIETPNLDRLVERGTSFTHAHIPGGTAGAVCMPSRAMLHTGRTLFHLKDKGQQIPPEHITLGEQLQKEGYNCCGIGKWHNGTDSYARSFNDGENIFFGGMWDHWNVPVNDYSPEGRYDSTINYTPSFTTSNDSVVVRAQKINAGQHSTELFSGSALRYIEDYNDDKPFFLYVSYLAPHDPRTMPERFRTMYRPEDMELPANFSAMPVVNYGWSEGRDESLESYPRSPERIKQHIADYYAMISHLDWNVGLLLDALETKGLLKDTIIVLSGDNGLAIGQHGLMGKQNLYEHSIRVPLLISGPGVPAGVRCAQYVYLLDIYPTLCDLCGVPVPHSVEGKSFAPLLKNPNAVIREDLYLAFQSRIRGIKDKRYKLLEYRTEHVKLTQLFDLELDPLEMNNFFDVDGYREISHRLRIRLLQLRDEWEDEAHPTGKHFWDVYRAYEDALTPNPERSPNRKNVAGQAGVGK